jgi:hypothetical protein
VHFASVSEVQYYSSMCTNRRKIYIQKQKKECTLLCVCIGTVENPQQHTVPLGQALWNVEAVEGQVLVGHGAQLSHL